MADVRTAVGLLIRSQSEHQGELVSSTAESSGHQLIKPGLVGPAEFTGPAGYPKHLISNKPLNAERRFAVFYYVSPPT